MNDNTLNLAFQEYQDRQSRASHPDGTFDNGGRWYPDDNEYQECCNRIRSPSRSYPYSLLLHCRTLRHVSKLYGVKESDVKKMVQYSQQSREGGNNYYKVVAVVDDRFYSIFDGETEYILNQKMVERARQNHEGGFYVYPTIESARNAPFPGNSFFDPNLVTKAILRLRCEGQYCRYKNDYAEDKLSFSTVTPLEIMEWL